MTYHKQIPVGKLAIIRNSAVASLHSTLDEVKQELSKLASMVEVHVCLRTGYGFRWFRPFRKDGSITLQRYN